MQKPYLKACRIISINLILISGILNFAVPLFADNLFNLNDGIFTKKETAARKINDSSAELRLASMQDLARKYRQEGLDLQKRGDLQGAMGAFQKAIYADPFYAVPYNDLGVIYEAQGEREVAKQYYLRAIQIDSGYLSAYSNLALAYEAERDLKNAATYWQKRVELGVPDDPWTQRAQKQYENIQMVLGEKKLPQLNEQEIIRLAGDMADQKEILREDDNAQAKVYLNKAKVYYQRGEIAAALKEAINARQIVSDTREADDFIDKAQKRLLTR